MVGGEANRPVVNVLQQEYDLDKHKVAFKDLTAADVPQAFKSKQISAVLFVIPVAEKYLSMVRATVRDPREQSRTFLVRTKATICPKAPFGVRRRFPMTI